MSEKFQVDSPSMYFYHSFPRMPHQEDITLGLNILESILRHGLLLTPELQILTAANGLEEIKYIQERVCFTVLEEKTLFDHSKTFGHFSLEFNPEKILSFGITPALYLPGIPITGDLLNQSGAALIRCLAEALKILDQLHLMQDGKTVISPDLAKYVLSVIKPNNVPIESFRFALQAILNLYYPTDGVTRANPTKLLHYYRQREWKIIPNYAVGNEWPYPLLTTEEQMRLIKINPTYFGGELSGKARSEYCRHFLKVAGHNVLNTIRRIIVPDKALDKAIEIVTDLLPEIQVLPESALIKSKSI